MDPDEMYELVYEASRAALNDALGGGEARLARRLTEGKVTFEDGDGKITKEIPASHVFRKVTAVREKLRVLEQRINNHDALTTSDKAELQAYISRAYGSLTTFNFMFRDEAHKFRGTGG